MSNTTYTGGYPSRSCPICGRDLTDTCCDDVAKLKAAYRHAQTERAQLFDAFSIEHTQNPSRVYKGEWETVPVIDSLVAFLSELPMQDHERALIRELRGNPLCGEVRNSPGKSLAVREYFSPWAE